MNDELQQLNGDMHTGRLSRLKKVDQWSSGWKEEVAVAADLKVVKKYVTGSCWRITEENVRGGQEQLTFVMPIKKTKKQESNTF